MNMDHNLLLVRRLVIFVPLILVFAPVRCSNMTNTTTRAPESTTQPVNVSSLKVQLQAMETKMENLYSAFQSSQKQLNITKQKLSRLEEKQASITLQCACGGNCCKIPGILKQLQQLKKTTNKVQKWVNQQKKQVSVKEILKTQDNLNRSIVAVMTRLENFIKNSSASASGKPNNCRRYQPWTKAIRQIWINSIPRNVSCDGEWTVIQKRWNGQVNFSRAWNDYVNGFGDATTEYWLGLDALTKLTERGKWELRVELGDWDNTTAYALYRGFRVQSSDKYFALQLGQFVNGNAGDSLKTTHDGMKFTTIDNDNDNWKKDNCAKKNYGGWWFNACLISNLNGKYYTSSRALNDGIIWKKWKGFNYSLKTTLMKIRPV